VGREAAALADYEKAIGLAPDYASAYASRGALHGRHGRDTEALADLDRALTLVPDYPWALVHRSQAHRRRGAFDRALADARRAVELDPEGAWALSNRIQTDIGVGRLEQAQAAVERYVALGGDPAWADREAAALRPDVRLGVALSLALETSRREGMAAARPRWTSCARLARHLDTHPNTPDDLVEVLISAGLQAWSDLDDRLHQALSVPHEWPDLATLASGLDTLLHSPGTDHARLAPALARVTAARDALQARYAD
jgi:hypothetical protein